MVNVQTWWWPEYTFKYDEYYCANREWSNCFGRESAPIGQTTQSCSSSECPDGFAWCGRVSTCTEWRWRNVSDPMSCPPGNLSDTGWCRYDLRQLGMNPLVGSTGNVVAGADAEGNRCGSWTDAYPCYVPVPCIEIQPEGVGWSD